MTAKELARKFGNRNGWTPGCASEQELEREFAALMQNGNDEPPKSRGQIAAEKAFAIVKGTVTDLCGVFPDESTIETAMPIAASMLLMIKGVLAAHVDSECDQAVREERKAIVKLVHNHVPSMYIDSILVAISARNK